MVPLLVIAGFIIGYLFLGFIVSGLCVRFEESINRFLLYAGWEPSSKEPLTEQDKIANRAFIFWGWPFIVLVLILYVGYYLPLAYLRWLEEEKPWIRKPGDDIVEKKPPPWGGNGF